MFTASKAGIRLAQAADAPDVARLHADSWRRHYRGAYSELYLDGDLVGDRLAVWGERLDQPESDHFTVVAEHRRELIGFAHIALDADPTWGALVENLHVVHFLQRNGVGGRLLDAAARIALERRPQAGIYLWVLEQNEAAQSFYRSRGGTLAGREPATPPHGDPRNLDGAPTKIRVAWSDPAALMLARD
jgi:ribosomal protein S18 acetylase RimI-like enzyme